MCVKRSGIQIVDKLIKKPLIKQKKSETLYVFQMNNIII